MAFELYPEDAPWHVANFKYLADRGFYRGRSFHIAISNYIVQAGATKEPALMYQLPPEFNTHTHKDGTLGMARAPDPLNPGRNSSSSQFHILLTPAPNMNGSYTVFGKLIDGEDVLSKIRQGDIIREVTVFVEGDQSAEAQPQQRFPPDSPSAEWILPDDGMFGGYAWRQ